MNDVETTAGEGFSPEEKAYFESRGEASTSAEPSAVAPEVTAEAAPAAEQTAEPAETKDKTVPHGAFHEERQRRKQAEEKARALEIENAKAIARLEALLQNNREPERKEAVPEAPKPEEDIFGAFDHQGKRVETIEQKLERLEQERQREAVVQNVLRASHEHEKTFMETSPDYPDALNHLRQSRIAELVFFGMDEASARARVGQEEINVAAQALQQRRNPAEVIYEFAVKRGYAKKAPPAPNPQPEPDPAQKLQTIEAAQTANRSLSSTGGGASAPQITAAELLAMPDKEFEAFKNSNPAKFRRIMGSMN